MLELVRVFVKVADASSFSKAGRQLSMAPSSITRKIDSLETELGVSLFLRSTRQLVLTENGAIFLDGARKLLEQAEILGASIQESTAEPAGTIRISVFESFGRLQICPIVPEFVLKYPKVKVELELDNKLIDLASEEVDLAIRIGRPVDSGLRARKLVSNHTVVCASPLYLQKYGTPIRPEDLAEHNCLTLSSKRQLTYWHFRKGKEYKRVQVTGNISSSGGTPLLEAAEKGIGIVLLPNWMVSRSIKENKLAMLNFDWDASRHEDSSGEVYAVFANSKYTKSSLRAFIDYLAEIIHDEGLN